MAIYVKDNNKVTDIFVNVNSSKKKIKSAWVNRNGIATKVFGSENLSMKNNAWTDGTWAEISSILDAHYAGEIDIADYWNIGDTRTVNLATMSKDYYYYNEAQTVELTIIDFNHDTLEKGITLKSAVTLQMKDCLNEAIQMKNSKSNAGGWEYSNCRTFCNSTFKNALPSELQKLIKTVLKNTSQGSQSNSIIRSHDQCFLLSVSEIVGNYECSAQNEGTKYEYYKKENNITKISPNGRGWWTRSPMTNDTEAFNFVKRDGTVSGDYASNSYGLSVAMCI